MTGFLQGGRSAGSVMGNQLGAVDVKRVRWKSRFRLGNDSHIRFQAGLCPQRSNRGSAAFVVMAALIRMDRRPGRTPFCDWRIGRLSPMMAMTAGRVVHACRLQRLADTVRTCSLHRPGSCKRCADPGNQDEYQQLGGSTLHASPALGGEPLRSLHPPQCGCKGVALASIGQFHGSHNPRDLRPQAPG